MRPYNYVNVEFVTLCNVKLRSLMRPYNYANIILCKTFHYLLLFIITLYKIKYVFTDLKAFTSVFIFSKYTHNFIYTQNIY